MTTNSKDCVILVGHGGVPTDCPPALVSEFKKQEALARGKPTPALLEADKKLRDWPRTPQTDPYKAGLETISQALAQALPGRIVLEAYNEFCAPSLEDAFAEAVRRGCKNVTFISTMFTRGGVHSECEIPEIVSRLRAEYPGVEIRYAWPYDLTCVAELLAGEVRRAQKEAPIA